VAGRRYTRDRKGRFSSTGATARGGRLTTAKGKRYETQTKEIAGGSKGVIRAKRKPATRPSIEPPKTPALGPAVGANNIRRVGKSKTGHPRALRANAVRSYRPQTPNGAAAHAVRQIQRVAGKPDTSLKGRVRKVLDEHDKFTQSMHRRQAKAIADRLTPGIDQRMASVYLKAGGSGLNRGGADVIKRRGERAAAAAARGSKPAAKAVKIYDEQLANTGRGKATAAKNNIQPGRGNSRPPKPRRRKSK